VTGLRALVAAVGPHLDELRERSEQSHYGYCVVENPHDFTPDIETNTPEEIANHRAACEAWDRGEREGVTPLGCGNLPRMDGWGLGGQTLRGPAASAVVALIEAITPDVLAAVEQSADLRTTLARLTADLAAVTAERDELRLTLRGPAGTMASLLRRAEADRDEARGLLEECLDGEWIECVNEPECDDEHEPLDERHWCQRCQMRRRVAVHLGRRDSFESAKLTTGEFNEP